MAGKLAQSSNDLTCSGFCGARKYLGVDCQVSVPSRLGGSVSGIVVKCSRLLPTSGKITNAESYNTGAKSNKTCYTFNSYLHRLHYRPETPGPPQLPTGSIAATYKHSMTPLVHDEYDFGKVT